MNTQLTYWRYACVALIIIALDQISKWAVLARMEYGERLPILPSFFDLILVYNKGAAFSFLADAGGWQKFFFLILAVLICAWLMRLMWQNELGRLGNWGATWIIGGAIGNVIDRLIHGHVIDFILLYYQDWYYPAFNLADSFICMGAALLALDGLKKKPQMPSETNP